MLTFKNDYHSLIGDNSVFELFSVLTLKLTPYYAVQ